MTTTHDCLSILQELVDAVNATGGVVINHHGLPDLVADPDWLDLAIIAEKAHDTLLAAGWPSKLEGYDDDNK
jgi:hypothetical protein